LRKLQVAERLALDELLDRVMVGHIGLTVDGQPVVVPTGIARLEDAVVVHGSTGSPWMRAVAEGTPTCLAVTSLDGIVVARSAFESSLHYGSAVIFGRFERLEGDDKERALEVLTEKLLPGRVAEVRPPTRHELNKTMVLSVPIERWSLKVSDGWPDDSAEDVAGSTWAGVVPLTERAGLARPAPDLRPGVPVPASVAVLTGGVPSRSGRGGRCGP